MTDLTQAHRTIGHGVVAAYAVASVVTGATVIVGPVGADVGLLAWVGMFVLVFLGDQAIQYQDMHYDETAADRPRPGDRVSDESTGD